ncbi:DUF5334 family protein [Aestuariivirga litoralis]|uniref:DUF5334 family protein n=1 Tax=Aestuariivirga litoralis TaxID=2650924 RepID=UPI0018C45870|nr:DUF5334 family protein [Aestuariivirga litoralis]MBG1232567.1 hypothetical protein [Aestuariivirga litoralis]
MRFTLPAFLLASLVFVASPAFAKDGTNLDTGDTVSVDDSATFNVGDVVAVFDADGNEIDVEIQAVKDTGDALDIDVIDQDSGESATFEFAK